MVANVELYLVPVYDMYYVRKSQITWLSRQNYNQLFDVVLRSSSLVNANCENTCVRTYFALFSLNGREKQLKHAEKNKRDAKDERRLSYCRYTWCVHLLCHLRK